MNKIEAIKITRQVTNLGLKESKDLVEALIPYLQLSREEIQSQIDNVRTQIDGFHTNIYAEMTEETAQRLVNLIKQRNDLQKMIGFSY